MRNLARGRIGDYRPSDAFALATRILCDRSPPEQNDFASAFGGVSCLGSVTPFPTVRPEVTFTFECNRPFETFGIQAPAGTTITNSLAPEGAACSISDASYLSCQSLTGSPFPALAVVSGRLALDREVDPTDVFLLALFGPDFLSVEYLLQHTVVIPD